MTTWVATARLASGLSLGVVFRLGALLAWAVLATQLWHDPAWRATLLLTAAFVAWAADLVPDFVVALGLVVAWNVSGAGPAGASLSGFVSPSWFLLAGVLTLAAALTRCGLLQRLALRLLLVFPPTFRGQALGLIVGGLVTTPLLPLTVARSALSAPLAVSLAESLGYPARSRPAVGLGLAAFVGSGLLSRVFLSGATLNLMAWSLLPPESRLGWGAWAVAAAPTAVVLVLGSLAMILWRFAPAAEEHLSRSVIASRLQALGPVSRAEVVTGLAVLGVAAGFSVGPRFGIECAWVVWAGALALLATNILSRETLRTAVDWPLLLFLGVVLGMPEMLRHAGLDARLTDLARAALRWGEGSSVLAITVLFLVMVAARFVLSEWVAVPLFTVTLVPAAAAVGLDPWVVVLVVLTAGNLWVYPYQFASYAAFFGASEGRLFGHGQVRAFSVGYMALALVGLVASVPLWFALGLVR